MWIERRIVTLDVWSWILIGCWAWFWPGVALVVIKGLAGGLVFLIAMLGRAVAMMVSNRLAGWHRGLHIVQDSGSLLKIHMAQSWKVLGLYGVISGTVLGLAVWGVFGPMPFWAGIVVWGLSLIAQGITILLYNGIVVPFYGGWQWRQQLEAGKLRIVDFTPNQTRLFFATLLFAWTVVIVVLLIIVWILFFAAVHRVLPQGFFSLGVIVFSSFLVAVVGFVCAVVLGWWFYWGATLYNRWVTHGGGVYMTSDTTEIAL